MDGGRSTPSSRHRLCRSWRFRAMCQKVPGSRDSSRSGCTRSPRSARRFAGIRGHWRALAPRELFPVARSQASHEKPAPVLSLFFGLFRPVFFLAEPPNSSNSGLEHDGSPTNLDSGKSVQSAVSASCHCSGKPFPNGNPDPIKHQPRVGIHVDLVLRQPHRPDRLAHRP